MVVFFVGKNRCISVAVLYRVFNDQEIFVNKMLSKVPKFIKYWVNLNHINQPHIPIASLRINQTYLDTLY